METRQVSLENTNSNETLQSRRNGPIRHQNRGFVYVPGQVRRKPEYRPGGDLREGGVSVRQVCYETWEPVVPMIRRKFKQVVPARVKADAEHKGGSIRSNVDYCNGVSMERRRATWLGSTKRITTQLFIAFWSHITLPWAKFEKEASKKYFTDIYNNEKSDPFIFDGKDNRYFDQIESMVSSENYRLYNIVDLGCGDCSLLNWLISKGYESEKYLGIDFAHSPVFKLYEVKLVKKNLNELKQKDIPKNSIVFIINTSCYLDVSDFNKVLNSINKCSRVILIEPYPGFFWDSHFSGVRLYYRYPKKILEIFKCFGFTAELESRDYALKIHKWFLFPLSYAILFKRNVR